VGIVEDVEAGELVERHPLVEHRIGLSAKHLYMVAEVGERPAQVVDVHPLPAAMGLAPVRQKGDFERAISRDHSPTRLSEFGEFGKCSTTEMGRYLGAVRALVQRAAEARVRVDDEVIGEIGPVTLMVEV
jgi:hypothetical protein